MNPRTWLINLVRVRTSTSRDFVTARSASASRLRRRVEASQRVHQVVRALRLRPQHRGRDWGVVHPSLRDQRRGLLRPRRCRCALSAWVRREFSCGIASVCSRRWLRGPLRTAVDTGSPRVHRSDRRDPRSRSHCLLPGRTWDSLACLNSSRCTARSPRQARGQATKCVLRSAGACVRVACS
jgi:hypothetical protein